MAAPKGPDAFSGETFRGSRNPQGVCRAARWTGWKWAGPADEAESRPPPGAACFSLAVPERACRTRGDRSPASTGQFRSDAIDLLGVRDRWA
jgi:hypothetical protein